MNHVSTPLVSVVTPVFNAEKFIAQTIQSVISQTYTNWELILVDDGSVDKSLEIISDFQKKHSNIFLYKNVQNSGAAITRNKGMAEAKGAYIAFLDADDFWLPEKLEIQIGLMESRQLEVSFSSYNLMDANGNLLGQHVQALKKLTYNKLLKCNYIGNLTGVYNAERLGKIYTKNLRKRQDWLLWLEAVKRTKQPVIGIQEPLANYRLQPNSMSANKLGLIKYNYSVYKTGLNFSTVKSVYFMLLFIYEYIFVKSKNTIETPKT
ncbi:glycosyltransferase family 2 protein [Formosa sediminum]|uniref:Glycosyltransferase family 2 protein n=1 Tax=Formosa sediminum TaxID=2594004 RepID=A0A516GNP2_9FLAO|nr:glycosyltransferase family 2 protein [Formosa sediminum]QDO93144.1 glycosyltransferase family 2 protein [Formosa sediminum]